MNKNKQDTSWESSSAWYDKLVSVEGHYYHREIIIPGVLDLLKQYPDPDGFLLDLACGQGVLSRHLPKEMKYIGVDASPSLIQSAQKNASDNHQFFVHDFTDVLPIPKMLCSHACCILALQNMSSIAPILQTAWEHLKKNAPLILVLNHPSFRIPRQSSWGVDLEKKLQYRRMDCYMTPLKIPIQTHPSLKTKSETTWSFHYPLSTYSTLLKESGFTIDIIQEWCSNKKSQGKMATMENRSRKEFPLFMTLVARKI
ncbi:class I SAM-dependent methyltransferase [Candidatus Rhabdochlamydia sp. T3358]|uniref:class I SAM-dependent methyltransferase n=1 Tax=Candidatus Rhabdochlamydia sp. T3358 TaxID=2099795 RepID=UPI0010BBECAD|nr:class I SAM-dependent methyltransferase [Candidatus Rhabdochlamydia sp. T3358]VHO03177.1 Ubiquinone/menaquinone biosynthesis C-methyltransferase UbiE [Candidatus Rhabdochlamydia sp. T3358]